MLTGAYPSIGCNLLLGTHLNQPAIDLNQCRARIRGKLNAATLPHMLSWLVHGQFFYFLLQPLNFRVHDFNLKPKIVQLTQF
jgi:hypothetical protein